MIIMTRSEFFKKFGIGAIICAMAPKILAERKSFDLPSEIKRVGNTARITEADRETQRLHSEMINGHYFYLIEDKEGNVFKADENGISKIITKKPLKIIKVNYGNESIL